MFPHGFKGQNESCRELQNGSETGLSEGEFDWFLRGGILLLDRFLEGSLIGFWRGILAWAAGWEVFQC